MSNVSILTNPNSGGSESWHRRLLTLNASYYSHSRWYENIFYYVHVLSTCVDAFEPVLLRSWKMTVCVFLCIQANSIRGTSTVMVTFPYTFQLVCIFLKVDWVFSCVICALFDGVVQITGESKGKRIFWRSNMAVHFVIWPYLLS